MKSKGFSLIELMIYLTLALFIMYHCVPWSVGILFRYNVLHTHAKNSIDCCISRDLFMKDVFEGICKKEAWIIQDAQHIIWEKNDHTYVGWSYENNHLFRISGFFDKKHNEWHKKHTVPLLHHVQHLFFTIDCDPLYIRTVTLNIKMYNVDYSFMGVPRYGHY